MSEIDIEAIRRNAISPGVHSEANSVYWWKTSQALLDAYEAEHAEVLRLKGLWGAACDLNADLDVEREHAVVEAELLRLRANRAERKLQAISDLAAGWDSYDSVDLLTGIRAIINPPAALPEETPTDE
jgi:hypothetical protein